MRARGASHRTGQTPGFTLIECLLVCAAAGVLAAVAVPSYQAQERRSARLDAVAALTRVQVAQERHRNLHGEYAADFAALGVASPASPQGRYVLSLTALGTESYRATATAQGLQSRDSDCPTLTLDVASGYPTEGPAPGCWPR